MNQDNQTTRLLSRNGKDSSYKRNKYINIRYLFVTYRIANKEMSVEYCPTYEMLGDFFTKTNQGSLFRKLHKLIINLRTDDIYRYDTKISQECFGYPYPLYKQQTDDSMLHPEPSRWSDIVRGQDGIRPGPSMNKAVLKPGPSRDRTRVGIRHD